MDDRGGSSQLTKYVFFYGGLFISGVTQPIPRFLFEPGGRKMDDFFNIAFHEAVTPGSRSQSSTRYP